MCDLLKKASLGVTQQEMRVCTVSWVAQFGTMNVLPLSKEGAKQERVKEWHDRDDCGVGQRVAR